MSISVGMVGLGMFGPSFIQSYKLHRMYIDWHYVICSQTGCQNGQNSLRFPKRMPVLMRYANRT